MKNHVFHFLILLLTATFFSCQDKKPLDIDVSHIDAQVEFIRFDKEFYGNSPEKLPEIKSKYAYLFAPKTPDSIWVEKMQDSMFLDLKTQVDSVFPDMNRYREPITGLYKHIKYYFPQFNDPKILTIYSDWNYLRRAVYADSLELLTLDNFLGKDNRVYKGIPQYIRQNLIPERIPVEIANSYIETLVPAPKAKNLLSKMINAGKKLYLLDAFLPATPDSLKIGYTAEKLKWAQDNEENVWQYFIEEKLLFNYAKSLDMRFLNLAPYSKFYTEADRESPGRIGQYIGWQIVRRYMQKNKVSLQKLLQTPEEEIFNQSKYKPKR